MKLFEVKVEENQIGKWNHYFILGHEVHVKLIRKYI